MPFSSPFSCVLYVPASPASSRVQGKALRVHKALTETLETKGDLDADVHDVQETLGENAILEVADS